jgi:hypothetical protein
MAQGVLSTSTKIACVSSTTLGLSQYAAYEFSG